MKKVLSLILAIFMLSTMLCAVASAEGGEATFLYVATNGSDSNAGTKAAPFATIAKAVTAARKISGTVVINLAGGSYTAKETVKLTAADKDLVIRAIPGETVSINGGVEIPYSDFKAVSAEISERIVKTSARDKVKTVNLKDYGITDFGGMGLNGAEVTDINAYPSTLSYKDEFMTIAQYPNGDEYLYTGDIKDDGSNGKVEEGNIVSCTYTVKNFTQYKKWEKAEDIWALGFVTYDWADVTAPASIDFKTGTVTGYTTARYAAKSDRRVKFLNLLEEIDVPGEWYLNSETGDIYVYAPENMKATEKFTFTSYQKPFFSIEGSKNITIENIRFAGTRVRGIDVKKADNVVINNCEITNIGDTAVYFDQCKNSGVKNSYVHDLGSWGIYLYKCGDKVTLTPGNCFVENCEIRTFSQYKKTYSPGIHMFEDVGNRISHNEIHDAPHFAIRYDSNDAIIEYNEFYDVCQDTADSGAVYTGRYYDTRGNVIRYNYFHDLEMIDTTTGMEMQAIYLDDLHSSTSVFGNVFYKVDSVALMGGGRNNSFENNLMIDCKKPLVFDNYGISGVRARFVDQALNKSKNIDWTKGKWAEKYPELKTLKSDDVAVPKYNVLQNNVYYNTPEFELFPEVIQYGTVKNNVKITDKKAFADYSKQNFALSKDSSIYSKLPDFQEIPFADMGRVKYTYEDKWTEKNAATTTPATTSKDIKVLLDGKAITFDVQPTIINNRTMVPLRAIFEALGATVDWNADTKTVTAVKGDTTIVMQIGNSVMKKNGAESTLDSAPVILNNRTLVPVRAIAESFGNDVGWDGDTRTVTIKSK